MEMLLKKSAVHLLLKGEVPDGKSFILSGYPMVGKSLVVNNIFGSNLHKGKKGLYIALERPIETIILQLKKLGYEDEIKNIIFVDAYSWRVGGESIAKHQLRNLSNLNELSVKLLTAVEELGKGGFFIVDSITNLANFLGVNSARFQKNGTTGIWVVEEGIHQPSFYHMLNHMADGILEMKLKDVSSNSTRWIRSRALRGEPNVMDWFNVKIASEGLTTLGEPEEK
jgi:KaiC/GvpD/RAD55 family RecA-like ATPase